MKQRKSEKRDGPLLRGWLIYKNVIGKFLKKRAASEEGWSLIQVVFHKRFPLSTSLWNVPCPELNHFHFLSLTLYTPSAPGRPTRSEKRIWVCEKHRLETMPGTVYHEKPVLCKMNTLPFSCAWFTDVPVLDAEMPPPLNKWFTQHFILLTTISCAEGGTTGSEKTKTPPLELLQNSPVAIHAHPFQLIISNIRTLHTLCGPATFLCSHCSLLGSYHCQMNFCMGTIKLYCTVRIHHSVHCTYCIIIYTPSSLCIVGTV